MFHMQNVSMKADKSSLFLVFTMQSRKTMEKIKTKKSYYLLNVKR